MERQTTAAVSNAITNPTAPGAATSANTTTSYFDLASTHPALGGHQLSSPAFLTSPRITDAITANLNNGTSIMSQKGLHRTTAAGTLVGRTMLAQPHPPSTRLHSSLEPVV